MELTCKKSEFSIPEHEHYLNCAYMAPLPRRVEAAGQAGMAAKREPWRITPVDFFEPAERVRALFARLIGATDPHGHAETIAPGATPEPPPSEDGIGATDGQGHAETIATPI